MRYKIAYHVGKSLDPKTKASAGVVILSHQGFRVEGSTTFLEESFSSVREVALFRLHGLGRMIKVVCQDRTLFLTAVRLNLFGAFLIVDFRAAGELYEGLRAGWRATIPPELTPADTPTGRGDEPTPSA